RATRSHWNRHWQRVARSRPLARSRWLPFRTGDGMRNEGLLFPWFSWSAGVALAVGVTLAAVGQPVAQGEGCGVPRELRDGWVRASAAETDIDERRLCGLDQFIAQWPRANIHGV